MDKPQSTYIYPFIVVYNYGYGYYLPKFITNHLPNNNDFCETYGYTI
jgi:hypothetical protein